MRSLKKLGSDNQELNRFQEYVQATLAPVLKSPLLDGVLLTNITLINGTPLEIDHKLGREPLGWFVVSPDALSRIFQVQANKRTLTLQSSGDVSLKIWVF